jgi:hypothetical protein
MQKYLFAVRLSGIVWIYVTTMGMKIHLNEALEWQDNLQARQVILIGKMGYINDGNEDEKKYEEL